MSNENERAWPVANHDNCCGYRLFARHSALHPDSHDVTTKIEYFYVRVQVMPRKRSSSQA